MATELAVQSERAFQKQPHIFQNAKVASKNSKKGKGGKRWYKEVGLGFRTPKLAIEGNYIGMRDPATGLHHMDLGGLKSWLGGVSTGQLY